MFTDKWDCDCFEEDTEGCFDNQLCCASLVKEGLASPNSCGTHCGPDCCDIMDYYELPDGRKAFICIQMYYHLLEIKNIEIKEC